MDIGAIRRAIATVLGRLDIRTYGYVPDNPIVPCVVVYPKPFNYAATFDPTEQPQFALWCISGMVNAESAQAVLDGWLSTSGPTSITQAIDNNSTLDGAVPSAVITRLDAYGAAPLTEGGPRYLQATLLLDVYV